MVALRLSLYKSQPPWWYSDSPYIHRSLHGGTQTLPLDITDSMVVFRLSLYTSQPPWRYSDSPYINHSLNGGIQTLPIYIAASMVVFRLSLYTSQPPWWYLGNTHLLLRFREQPGYAYCAIYRSTRLSAWQGPLHHKWSKTRTPYKKIAFLDNLVRGLNLNLKDISESV